MASPIFNHGGCFYLHKVPNGQIKYQYMTMVVLDHLEKVAFVDYLINVFMRRILSWSGSMLYTKMVTGTAKSLFYFLLGSSPYII